MDLYLYNYENGTTSEILSWDPLEEQWWITGFDSSFTNPVPDNMGVVGSVDFSTDSKLYYALKNTYLSNDEKPQAMHPYQFLDGKTCLVFDDETYTVWIVRRETKSCQENV